MAIDVDREYTVVSITRQDVLDYCYNYFGGSTEMTLTAAAVLHSIDDETLSDVIEMCLVRYDEVFQIDMADVMDRLVLKLILLSKLKKKGDR